MCVCVQSVLWFRAPWTSGSDSLSVSQTTWVRITLKVLLFFFFFLFFLFFVSLLARADIWAAELATWGVGPDVNVNILSFGDACTSKQLIETSIILFWIIQHWSTNNCSFVWSCDPGIQDTSCLPNFLPAANRHIFCICTSQVHQPTCIIILFESVHHCTQAIRTYTHKPEYEAGDSTRSKSCATEFKCSAVVYLSAFNVPSPLSRVCMSKSQHHNSWQFSSPFISIENSWICFWRE